MEGMGGAAIAKMLKENCYITGGFTRHTSVHTFSFFFPSHSASPFSSKRASLTPTHEPLSPQLYAAEHYLTSGVPV